MGWGRSLIAGVNALFRATETQRPPDRRILSDPYADRFAERHLLVWTIRLARFFIPSLRRTLDALVTAHGVRHAAIDALVGEALGLGAVQVVTLGAGYDMRPARLGEAHPQVRWFEVDLPAVARRKRARMRGVSAPLGQAVVADLREGPLVPALVAAGLDPARPTLWVLEGLIHYLPRARVASLLAELAQGPGPRRLVLSFITPEMVRQADPTFRNLLRLVAEIPRTYFRPEDLARLAQDAGWRSFRSWTWSEQACAFAPVALGRDPGVTQEVAVLVGAPAVAERTQAATGGVHDDSPEPRRAV